MNRNDAVRGTRVRVRDAVVLLHRGREGEIGARADSDGMCLVTLDKTSTSKRIAAWLHHDDLEALS